MLMLMADRDVGREIGIARLAVAWELVRSAHCSAFDCSLVAVVVVFAASVVVAVAVAVAVAAGAFQVRCLSVGSHGLVDHPAHFPNCLCCGQDHLGFEDLLRRSLMPEAVEIVMVAMLEVHSVVESHRVRDLVYGGSPVRWRHGHKAVGHHDCR